MKKLALASIIFPITLLISSCGFIDITINEDKVRNFAIENISNEKLQEIEDKISEYSNLSSEEIFVKLSENYNIPITKEQVNEITTTVCEATDNAAPIGSVIMNIIGIPITEQQVEQLIGLAIANFCPERVHE